MMIYSLVTLWYIPLRFRVSEERQFCLFPLPINLTYTKEAISSGVKLKQNATLFKNKLWQRCFPVNFAKFLRTPFSIEHLQWLLLNMKYKKEILSQIFYLIFYFILFYTLHVLCWKMTKNTLKILGCLQSKGF